MRFKHVRSPLTPEPSHSAHRLFSNPFLGKDHKNGAFENSRESTSKGEPPAV